MPIHGDTFPGHVCNFSTRALVLFAGLGAWVTSAEAAAPPHATVEGGLDKPAVREVVRAHIDEVRECYNAELRDDETLGGRVVVAFVVQPDGSVTDASVPESTMPKRFDACLITAVEAWSFPTSEAQTRVSYPFELSAG